jgi:hypothetical protein
MRWPRLIEKTTEAIDAIKRHPPALRLEKDPAGATVRALKF